MLEWSKKYKLNITLIKLDFDTIKNIWKYFENIERHPKQSNWHDILNF